MLKLQNGNIVLRSATEADAKQLAAWWNDGAVMAHAGFPNGLGITVEEVLSALDDNTLIIEENGIPIGESCYRIADEDEAVAEIGIKICLFEFQNRGIGRTVLSMLIRHLFDNGFRTICLDTNLKNRRAQHVYESLGFQKIRVNLDSWTDQLGQKQSSVDYVLTLENFIDYA